MLLPKHDLITLQNIIAFWQLTPILVNIPLWIASPFVSSAPTTKTSTKRTADIPHLKFLYGVLFLASIAVHWYTIYGIVVSEDPTVTFASVWVPSTNKWKDSFSSGLLFLFQIDWVITSVACLIATLVAVCDVQRLIHGSVFVGELAIAGVMILSLTLLAGPGAALTAVWYWREDKIALIEERLGASGAKKAL